MKNMGKAGGKKPSDVLKEWSRMEFRVIDIYFFPSYVLTGSIYPLITSTHKHFPTSLLSLFHLLTNGCLQFQCVASVRGVWGVMYHFC